MSRKEGNSLRTHDYVYTIHGWLKAINHTDYKKDPGSDWDGYPSWRWFADGDTAAGDPGERPNGGSPFLKDGYAEVLHYYEGDFRHNGSPFDDDENNLKGGDLFNGNISAWQEVVRGPYSPLARACRAALCASTLVPGQHSSVKYLHTAHILVIFSFAMSKKEGTSLRAQNKSGEAVYLKELRGKRGMKKLGLEGEYIGKKFWGHTQKGYGIAGDDHGQLSLSANLPEVVISAQISESGKAAAYQRAYELGYMPAQGPRWFWCTW